MRKTILGGIAVTASLGAVLASGAFADSTGKVTGGGQTLVGTSGAGNTIAFTVQNPDAPRGQVQYVGRDGTGKFHSASITCLQIDGNTARFAGTTREGGYFRIVVTDNGQGAADSNDMILIQQPTSSPSCDSQNGDDQGVDLARGNAQIHN